MAREPISISVSCKKGLTMASPVQLSSQQTVLTQLMSLLGDGAHENAAL